MQSVEQKVNDAAASVKERVVLRAKADEKADKSMASSKEDKEIAKQQKKAKEAEATMKKDEDKAGNAADHLQGRQQEQFAQHHASADAAAPVDQGNQYPPAAPVDQGNQYPTAAPAQDTAVPAPAQGPLDGHQSGMN